MDREKVAAAFNEWMRRYIEEPEQFAREWQTVSKFQAEANDGRTPTYGENCAGYLEFLMNGGDHAEAPAAPAAGTA